MRLTILALWSLVASCSERKAEASQDWLGAACGVPGLGFTVFHKKRRLVLSEYQVTGTVMTEDGIGSAPTSDRQKLIERALPCLEREAKRRGFTLEYPVMNVDA